MLDPQSPQGLAISNLFVLTLLIASGIFLLVTGLVIYIAVRYRHRAGQDDPRPNFGFTKLEIGWTIGPILILAVLAILTVQAMGTADPAVGQEQAKQPDLVVVGHQWWWEIGYPSIGITTANEIHIPVGKQVLVQVEAADVIHDLWIPQLGRKIDMIPGKTNYVWLRADKQGIYSGQCAEYCGVQHGGMLIRAIAQPQYLYDRWVAQQQRPATSPSGASALRGQQLFQQKTCISCHAINGTAANAHVGPDLTHLMSRQTLASGVIPNDHDHLYNWLKDPQAIKPGAYMPNMKLSEDELNDLVDYLESLK